MVPGDQRDPLQNREFKYKTIFNGKLSGPSTMVLFVGPNEWPSEISSSKQISNKGLQRIWV